MTPRRGFKGALMGLSLVLVTSPVTAADLIFQDNWTLMRVDSQETYREDGAAVNAFDGDASTIWHTDWSKINPAPPHDLQIDLGSTYSLSGFKYLPRPASAYTWSQNGRIAKYALYVSLDGTTWGTPVVSSSFANDASEKTVSFSAKVGRYVRLVANSEVNGNPWTSAAEINFVGSASGGSVSAPATSTTSSYTTSSVTTVSEPAVDTSSYSSDSDDPVSWGTLIGRASGTIYTVSSISQFDSVAAAVRPGDVVLFENGTYRGTLRIKSSGTADKPIIYTARNPGKVVFDGGDRLLVVTGKYNIVGGFVIKNVTSRVIQFTGSSGSGTVGALNNRVTDNVIIRSGSPDDSSCKCWMTEFERRAKNNRLDHNIFLESYGFVRVRIDDDALAYGPSFNNRIDHNIFSNAVGKGVPVIQLGSCGECFPGSEKLDVQTIFENNWIRNHDTGYRELISNKSSGNIIRNNTITSSIGSIELRYGNDVQVIGNYLGQGSDGSLNVNGAYHVVRGNTIESPGSAMPLAVWRSGDRSSAVGASLLPTHDIVVEGNYVSGYTRYALRVNDCNAEACDPISNVTIKGNILKGATGELFRYTAEGARNVVIDGNVYLASGDAEYGSGYSADRRPLTSSSTRPPLPPKPVLSSWAKLVSGG